MVSIGYFCIGQAANGHLCRYSVRNDPNDMTKNRLLLLLVLLLMQACQLNNLGDGNIVIDINDDFRLTFRENLATYGEDDLLFFLESIENRECSLDTLEVSVDNYATAVRLAIDVVNTSGSCEVGRRPSQTQVLSGPLVHERTGLYVQLEGLVDNKGYLLKDDTGFTIAMETSHGFYLPYETLQRVPSSAIWGYIGYPPANREQAQACFDELQALTRSIEVEEGEYGHFQVGKNQEVRVLGQENNVLYTQAFLRAFNLSDRTAIQTLFEDYEEEYPLMKLVFYDSFGGKYE